MPVVQAVLQGGRWAAVLGVLLLLPGCAGDRGHAAGPEQAVAAFTRALVARDGQAACALLAPKAFEDVQKSAGKPCRQAIGDQDLPADSAIAGSEVWGDRALVRTASDTVFVVRAGKRWLVVAAGCRPPAQDEPYDCQLEGT